MLTAKEFVRDIGINPEFELAVVDYLQPWLLKNRADILIVVDSSISVDPANDFGISRVIALIRAAQVGCMRFRVDLALRNGQAPTIVANPGPTQHKYRGFRFNMMDGANAVIDKYEQIWCFGFQPGNSGNPSDAPITNANALPSSDAELLKLSQWMKDKKGGLFATGDHHFLGASMCKRIPRLGTMRRWTNADGVPPIDTPARIDTLRPPSAAFEPGNPGGPLALGNSPHQGDLKVQPIQWTAWRFSFWPFGWRRRPHPVLCHPKLGPINVMPDHAHEGLCVETADIYLAATFNFGGGAQPEYPPAIDGGPQPAPAIIAYGSNLGDPPYNFVKGPQPARAKNPMISAYDGHRAGVGRVVTDSTWHHWFDVNIDDIQDANTHDWKLISRYFINIAVWLNPPGFSTNCFYLSAAISHFEDVGFQEYVARLPVLDLGKSLRGHLARYYGPCWVTERIWDIIRVKKLWPIEILRDPRPPVLDLGEIDPDILEELVLGHIVKATMKQAETVKAAAAAGKGRVVALAEPEAEFEAPLRAGLADMVAGMKEHFDRGAKITAALAR